MGKPERSLSSFKKHKKYLPWQIVVQMWPNSLSCGADAAKLGRNSSWPEKKTKINRKIEKSQANFSM